MIKLNKLEPIYLKEHENLPDEKDFSEIKFCKTEFGRAPKYLGISKDENDNLRTNFYIGATWLKENTALVVTPKYENIDLVKMIMTVLQFDEASDYFSSYFGIDYDKPFIKTDKFNKELTPLIIVYYLTILEKITFKGLKKGYVYREENLKSKVKGKIMLQTQLKKNEFLHRRDFVFCRFQEYTVDIPENRLLKKALIVCEKALYSINKNEGLLPLAAKLKKIKPYFNNVSEDIDISELKFLKNNKLFKDYIQGLEVAKIILKSFGVSILEKNKGKKISFVSYIPPFWIDMPRLFEVYVYSVLEKAFPQKIDFQVDGAHSTKADFVKSDECMILDAKYKNVYFENKEDGQKVDSSLEDIRELSGYARDSKIISKFKNKIKVPCVILYPIISNNENKFSNKILGEKGMEKLEGYEDFYKLGINIPEIN